MSARARASSSSETGLARHQLQLLQERRLDGGRVALRPCRHPTREHRAPRDQRQHERGHILRDPFVPHQALVQAAALAAGEDLRRDLQRVELGRAERRRAEAEVDAHQRHGVRHRLAVLPAEVRPDVRAWNGGIAGFAGIGPKYRRAASSASSASTSPTIDSTALLGA